VRTDVRVARITVVLIDTIRPVAGAEAVAVAAALPPAALRVVGGE